MYKFMKRLVIFLFFWVVFFSIIDKVKADTALIYHSNYSDAHTNVKSQLEADGYTVTLSTTGTIHENLFTNNIDGTSGGYDVVYDMKYNNSIGSNGKTRYQNFVQAGGVLVLVGENNANFSNNNQTIEAFVENKLGGTVSINGNTTGCAMNCTNNTNSNTITTTNTAITDSDYGSDVAVYPYGAHFTGDGTWLAKDGNGRILWMRWSGDQLPSGYSGAAYITFDINQFESPFDKAKMANMISDTYTSMQSASLPQAGITSSQQTEVNTLKNKSQTTNQIYLTQSGDGLDLDIVQDGDNNLIIGSDLTNAGSIQGDNNEITLTQTNDGNVLGIDVNGNTNNVDIVQNTNQNAIVNITGASNTLDLEQIHLNNNGSHYSKVTVNGNSNSLTIDQKETGDKILFLDVDSSNNVQVDQKGTGDHYLNIILTDSHTVDVTQDGTGDHDAHINLSGNNTSITLTQDSATDQNYYLEQNCSSASCSATVTQN
jgi:hypothetical protein